MLQYKTSFYRLAIIICGSICIWAAWHWPSFVWPRWNGNLNLAAAAWWLMLGPSAGCLAMTVLPQTYWKKVALSLTSTTLMLSLIELIFRLLGIGSTYIERIQNGKYYSYYANYATGWNYTRIPLSIDTVRFVGEYTYTIKTNSMGLLGPEHSKLPAMGIQRIMAIGDSYTEGVGAPQDSSWPAQLESKMGRGFEVINAGVAGSDIVFGAKLLETKLMALQPKHVLVMINESDVEDLMIRGGFERYKPGNRVEWRKAPSWEPAFALSYLLRRILRLFLFIDEKLIPRWQVSQLHEQSKQIMLAACDTIASTCNNRGVGFTFIVMPIKHEAKQNKYDKAQGFDIKLSKRYPQNTINLLPPLHKAFQQSSVLLYWPGDTHCTSYGYGLVADTLSSYLSLQLTQQGHADKVP